MQIPITRWTLALLTAVMLHASATAEEAQPGGTADHIAIQGYDVVSYFTDNKAMKGSPQFTHEHGGVTWQFASAEHRDMFKADPAKYAPQYGGYCAYGVAVSGLYDVRPDDSWSVVDGKLYLNKDPGVKQTWLKDVRGYIGKAETNWPKLRK